MSSPLERHKFVAEFLLGWTGDPPEACYLDLHDSPRSLDELNGWQGFGEILEAMRKQPENVRRRFAYELGGACDQWGEYDSAVTKFDELTPQLAVDAVCETFEKEWTKYQETHK